MQKHADDAARSQQPDQHHSAAHEPKITFQSPCMTIRQLRPPKKFDVQQFREYVDEQGIMRPVTGDEAVFAFVARGQQSGKVLAQRDAKHPRVLLLGDPKVPLGLNIALAHMGLGESANVTISAKLMHTTADADGRTHVLHKPRQEDGTSAPAAHDTQHSRSGLASKAPAESHSKRLRSSLGMERAKSLLDELQAEAHDGEDVLYEGLDLLAIVPGHGKRAAKPIMANAPSHDDGKTSGLTYHQLKKHAAAHAADYTNPDLVPYKRKNWFRRNLTIDLQAPWKAVKALGSCLGVRDLAIRRRFRSKDAKQQEQQQQQQQEAYGEEPKPGSMAVLTAH